MSTSKEYIGLRFERLNTITVQELRDALEGYDDDMLVVASCDYGDYHHTEQAVTLGEPTEVRLVASAYSQSGFAIDTKNDAQDDDEDDDEDRPLVLLLGYINQ